MVNLFIFEASDVEDGHVVIREEAKVSHLKTVLKAEVGSTIKMGMLGGALYTGHVVEIDKLFYRVRLEQVPSSDFDGIRESSHVCLLLGTPRPSMVKSIATVSATMGVEELLFVRSERVDKSYFQSKSLSEPEMKRAMLHGAEQGVTRRIPSFSSFPGLTLEQFLAQRLPQWETDFVEKHKCRIVKLIAEPRMPHNLVAAVLEGLKKNSNNNNNNNNNNNDVEKKEEGGDVFFLLAIGPEGGWIPPEVEMFRASGFLPFHMGDKILRTETAVIALLAQMTMLRDALALGQVQEQQQGDLKRVKISE